MQESVFDKSANLRYLDLSENKLEEIKSLTFKKLENLENLKIANNKLKGNGD